MKHFFASSLFLLLAAVTLTACQPDGRRHGRLMPGIRPYAAAGSAAETNSAANSDSDEAGFRPQAGDEEVVDSLCMVRGAEGRLLQRTGYVTLYDAERRCPRWTAWHLMADHTAGPYKRKGISFQDDDDVPAPRATDTDYQRSGYDRGHMCPSGDCQWSPEAQRQSFLFTNICPQAPSLNRGLWNDLENQCRTWAKEQGSVYIVCGPVWQSQRPRRIGHNKVNVPDGFFKVVLSMTDTPRAIGFYYVNDDQPDGSLADHVLSVDEVERMTGLDFFAALPDRTEQRVEAQADLDAW